MAYTNHLDKELSPTPPPTHNKIIPEIRFPEFKNADEWQTIKLEKYISFIPGRPFNSSDFIDNGVNNGVSVVNISNIQNNRVILDKAHTVPLDFYDNLEKYQLHYNDLVIVMSGPNVGKMGIFKLNEKALLSKNLGIIRVNNLNQTFVNYMLLNESAKALYKSQGRRLPKITPDDINHIKIEIPPTMEQQQKIANCLLSVDELIDLQQTKVNNLEQYKKGLLQKLTPNDERE